MRSPPSRVDALVRSHLGLVDRAATRFRRHPQLDDLLGAGREGLFRAAQSFDPNRGVPFTAFARPRIRGAMLDHLRSWGLLPKRVVRRAIGAPMMVDVDDVQIASGANPEGEYARAETLHRLDAALRVLKPKASTLIRTVYFDGASLTDAAGKLGISKSRGSRIVQTSLRRLSNVVDIEEKAKVVRAKGRSRSSRAALGLGVKSKTENVSRLPKKTRVYLRLVDDVDAARPRTRGDCENVERPCIFVGCRHNLYLDVKPNGSIRYNFPDKEPDEVDPDRSCALDIADRGGASLEDIAHLTNVTRQGVQLLEKTVIGRLRARSERRWTEAGALREYCDAPDLSATRVPSACTGAAFAKVDHLGDADGTRGNGEERELTGVSFFSTTPDADAHVCRSVWTMFARWQGVRGFEGSKAATAEACAEKVPARAHEGSESMAKEEDLTPRLKSVLDAHRALSSGGATPSVLDIAKRAGVAGDDDKKRASNVYEAMSQLRKRGFLVSNGKQRAPRESTQPSRPTRPRVVNGGGHRTSSVEAKPPRASSTDPTVALLIARRDDFRKKADALDVAIEALSEAL